MPHASLRRAAALSVLAALLLPGCLGPSPPAPLPGGSEPPGTPGQPPAGNGTSGAGTQPNGTPPDGTHANGTGVPAGPEYEAMTRWNGLLLPPGVRGEVVARNLSFPTSVDWDAQGNMYVGEVGFTAKGIQILRFPASAWRAGNATDAQATDLNVSGGTETGQLLDLTIDAPNGTLYFTTTGVLHALNLSGGGARDVVSGLPALGDHSTDEVVVAPDGRLYVTEGSATNSGVVGLDEGNASGAVDDVVHTLPQVHDVPCADVQASGVNYETQDIRAQPATVNAFEGAAGDARVVWLNTSEDLTAWEQGSHTGRALTGPFAPFGTPRVKGDTIPGDPRCNGALLSVNPDGSDLRAVAWGWRNPFAVAWHDGALWVSNNGFDNRGSRPVGATPDDLWRIDPAEATDAPAWFGWPDASSGHSLDEPFFSPLFGPAPVPLFDPAPGPLSKPVTFFSDHASANKFGFGPAGTPYADDIFVAQFGTLNAELVRGARTGMDVARADTRTGRVTEFITGQDRWGGQFRPVEAKFGPDGRLYVTDFGPWTLGEDVSGAKGADPGSMNTTAPIRFEPGTGRVLAFTLPSTLGWTGYPEGNVGGDGTQPWNGTLGDAAGGNASHGSIAAVEYAFGGGARSVRVGEAVTFVNRGMEGHTVTAVDGAFNSGFGFAPGAAFTWTPTKAGTYRYYCEVHPVMRGAVTVA